MKVDVNLDIGNKTFASGLLAELIAVFRSARRRFGRSGRGRRKRWPRVGNVVPVHGQCTARSYDCQGSDALGFSLWQQCGAW